MSKPTNIHGHIGGVLAAICSFFALLLMTRCSSVDSANSEGLEVNAAAGAASFMAASMLSPLLSALLERLKVLGYDGVGLEFESENTLEFLGRIFQSPRAANRKIKLMYTGMALSFDPKHNSLTIGGTTDVEAVLKYIEKQVPPKPVPPAAK